MRTKIDTIELDVAKGTEIVVGSSAEEQVPDGIGDLLALRVVFERNGRVVGGTAHAEDDQLSSTLAFLDSRDERRTILESSGASLTLGGRRSIQSAETETWVSAIGEEVAEESQVDNIIGRVGAHVVEGGAIIFSTPVDGEFVAVGSLGRGSGMGQRGQEAGSSQCVANKHFDACTIYTDE